MQEDATTNLSGLRVMVIDDSKTIRRTAETLLKREGAEVVTATDGFEALMAGKERVVSASLSTKLMGRSGRVLPDRAKARLHRSMAEPGTGKNV